MKKIITPAEIQEKEFSKSFRGYDEEEVDMFLDLITLDLEKLIKENLNLKAQIASLQKEQSSIGGSNLTVAETLETAKKIMDQLAESSEKRAEVLVSNAEMDAAIIIKDAKLKAEEVAANSAALTHSYEKFKTEYRELLERSMREFEALDKSITIDTIGSLLKEREEKSADDEVVIKKRTEESPAVEKIMKDSASSEEDDRKTMVNIRYE